MATILTLPSSANQSDLSSRLCVSLLGTLTALAIGFAVLLGSTLPPTFPSLPVMVPVEAAIRTAGAPGDARRDAAVMLRSPGHFLSILDRLAADRRSPAPTPSHRTGAEMETALARGTRAESAHLATIVLQPDGRDTRWDLMEMAAAQRRD